MKKTVLVLLMMVALIPLAANEKDLIGKWTADCEAIVYGEDMGETVLTLDKSGDGLLDIQGELIPFNWKIEKDLIIATMNEDDSSWEVMGWNYMQYNADEMKVIFWQMFNYGEFEKIQ